MSHDDPFASFESDRTFVMPSPGQRPARASPQDTPDRGESGNESGSVEALTPANGINPIVTAASPLLNVVPVIRASLKHPDPTGLRETLAEGIRTFERKAREGGVEQKNLIAARYILCTFLDETAASTPWGGSGVWGKQSLLVMFHNEGWGGEKVFQLMARLAESPRENRNLLELLYVVISLGFEGRYRVVDNGRAHLAQLRDRLYGMLKQQRGAFERELAPHWQGVQVQRGMFSMLPTWVVFAVVGLLGLGLYALLSFNLSNRSDPVFNDILALRASPPVAPALPVEPFVPPPAPTLKLAEFLDPEIRAGLVAVADFGDRSVITIRGDGFFRPASATVEDRVLPLLVRIGEALNSVEGQVLITGHTDSLPIRTARFPSNWHLSQDRARSVEALLANSVDPSRILAEGRADSEPVASNDTQGNRARNRRVEITLFASGTRN